MTARWLFSGSEPQRAALQMAMPIIAMVAAFPVARPTGPISLFGKTLCFSAVLGAVLFLFLAPFIAFSAHPENGRGRLIELDVLSIWMMAISVIGCCFWAKHEPNCEMCVR